MTIEKIDGGMSMNYESNTVTLDKGWIRMIVVAQ